MRGLTDPTSQPDPFRFAHLAKEGCVDVYDVADGPEYADTVKWRAEWLLEKYENTPSELVRAGVAVPDEVIHHTGNLLLLGGADMLWNGLTSTDGVTGTTGAKNTVYDNGNATILVGTSSGAAANTQVDLQASSNSQTTAYTVGREIAPMEATYPIHTTGDSSTANADCTFRGVFTTAMASFEWNEWGIGNSTSTTVPFKGRLINRKVQNLGTKTTNATWTLTVKLSLA